MKQIIVAIAFILLGVAIASYLNGSKDSSMKTGLTNVWQQEIERQNTYP
ncbi:hypothetical protein Ami103574_10885 [Aminipila butyrica]|uniref:Uncharacterized protein n=1 Tax=Aminipila butyrica TaxID=433296 RepID=A0A858BYL4_9FIRM|nr:hypothetical protein [Aminipila butyrica]QIB69794.1 hypothetical protein Ami103574_10885 [Aminipila butyrica]